MKICHWLPIEFRTKLKLLTIVFKTLQGNCQCYLQTKLNTMTYHRTTRRSTTKGITLKAPFNKKNTYGDCGLHIQQQHIGTCYLNTSGELRTSVLSRDCSKHITSN